MSVFTNIIFRILPYTPVYKSHSCIRINPKLETNIDKKP